MDYSLFYAKLIGFYFVFAALSMLINPKSVRAILIEASHNKSFTLLSGFLSLIFGLVVVLTHNVWSGWPIIITLIGYLSIIKGITRTCFTDWFEGFVPRFAQTKPYYTMSIFVLVLGFILLYLGYRY